MDADAYRAASAARWDRSATGWAKRREALQRAAAPVSHWMVDAIRPQPGHTVLELAAGPGDTGLLAAELVAPGGRLICSDAAEPMLDAARERARELGIANVDFRVIDAEWIDLDAASVDGVLCRWGYMLLADPAAALRETRRVLRPGGRLALAVWDARERNPWAMVLDTVLERLGLAQPPDEDAPGRWALAGPGRLEELLAAAGFLGVETGAIDFEFRSPGFGEWWATQLDLGVQLADLVNGLEPARREALEDAVRTALAPHTTAAGEVVLGARTLVAAADA